MKVRNAYKEGLGSFVELMLVIVSALFLSNLVFGPLGLKIFLAFLSFGSIFLRRWFDVDFIRMILVAGVFSIFFGLIFGDWRRIVVDLSWLTLVDDFVVNWDYVFVFLPFFGLFFFWERVKNESNEGPR